MWKCSACQNENKDEYRFCLNCGNPRPSSKKPASKAAAAKTEKKSSAMTILLLILSLLLIVAIVALIVNFPALSGTAKTEDEEITDRAGQRHSGGEKAADKSEWGGSSSFVFGKNTESAAASAAPGGTLPQPAESAAPSPSPVSTPAPTPEAVSEYLIPGSDSRYITEDDLKNLTWEQCCLARNEIFARHGRQFQTKEIASYFNSKSWYQGTIAPEKFSETVFNEYEKANVKFISQYETAHWGGSYY